MSQPTINVIEILHVVWCMPTTVRNITQQNVFLALNSDLIDFCVSSKAIICSTAIIYRSMY